MILKIFKHSLTIFLTSFDIMMYYFGLNVIGIEYTLERRISIFRRGMYFNDIYHVGLVVKKRDDLDVS